MMTESSSGKKEEKEQNVPVKKGKEKNCVLKIILFDIGSKNSYLNFMAQNWKFQRVIF